MVNDNPNENEKHLRIFEDRSEYISDAGYKEVFREGTLSGEANYRRKRIKEKFESGFLDQLIVELREGKTVVDIEKVSEVSQESLTGLVDSLTSEVGRALIGLSVMQLCIKAIEPSQNIRLHKGSASRGSFSWIEGISMRTLDKQHVTPALRRYDLLRLNADGFMMTRSLAENYPYTHLYKARLRGAKEHWLTLVEELEKGNTDPSESLKFVLSRLLNAAAEFDETADRLNEVVNKNLEKVSDKRSVIEIVLMHSDVSNYAARLLEVSMHALMQAAVSTEELGDLSVKPLSQMRSANKKHGNIGDIELLDNDEIVEAWDAKYGKGYLREEIEEAVEKLEQHAHVQVVGFVTNVAIERTDEIEERIQDIEILYSVKFEVLNFEVWVDQIYERCLSSGLIDEKTLSQQWLLIYSEYLGQKRREQAPIDEPCLEWVVSLIEIIENL